MSVIRVYVNRKELGHFHFARCGEGYRTFTSKNLGSLQALLNLKEGDKIGVRDQGEKKQTEVPYKEFRREYLEKTIAFYPDKESWARSVC